MWPRIENEGGNVISRVIGGLAMSEREYESLTMTHAQIYDHFFLRAMPGLSVYLMIPRVESLEHLGNYG